jgi:selenocysteine lyase/cysteine desulfurase
MEIIAARTSFGNRGHTDRDNRPRPWRADGQHGRRLRHRITDRQVPCAPWQTGGVDIATAQELWQPRPGWLNTASYGLPPRPAWDDMMDALNEWREGRTSWEGWDATTQRAREAFARLVGVDSGDVAQGAQVSSLLGHVAASLPDGTRVLVPDVEFTSFLYPFLVHTDRGITVETVPTNAYLDAIRPGIGVVAFSLVQSSNGDVAEYRRIVDAARAVGALVLVDATQACGWLPFDASLADGVFAAGYKWLMTPRGTALAYLAPTLRERMRPLAAGWYAGERPYESFYGLPMVLANDARAFDTSTAWFSWVAMVPTLELVEAIGLEAIRDHNVALANRFLDGLGRPPGNSAIVTVEVAGAQERLAAAGVRAAVRAGRVRASFHVYTTERDVDMALDALTR